MNHQADISQVSDAGRIVLIEKRLAYYCQRITDSVAAVGSARQIREFSSDQRKRVLATAMRPFLKDGKSFSAAEMLARSTEWYEQQMIQLEAQFEEAEKTLAAHEADRVGWESARSLLSMQRSLVNLQ